LAFSYGFADEPDYSKLKFLLARALLTLNLHPTQKFDWSLHKNKKIIQNRLFPNEENT
jgi:hypothetical protein